MKNKIIAGLVVIFWVSGCSTNPTICADYESSVNQAIQDNDLEKLESLFITLDNESDCSESYLDGVRLSITQIAAVQANGMVQRAAALYDDEEQPDNVEQQHQLLTDAEEMLKRATTITWQTQVVHGDIVAYRKQWHDAALYFAQALDLVDDFQATNQNQVPEATIEDIFQSALDAQLLAAELVMPKRSIGTENYPIPVQFQFSSSEMDATGEQVVQQMAEHINAGKFTHITLTGHADESGDHATNDELSEQRALTVKNYLQEQGDVEVEIDTIGKGKRQLLPPTRWKNLTPSEISQRNRRVEFQGAIDE